jgi:xanthine dehydrogenase accessory factor
MREVIEELQRWKEAGKAAALATVVQVTGSSLRPTSSKMALTDQQDIAGSVSGGCVESAIYEEAQSVLRTGEPKLLRYGVSDERAWEVGLACGGTIRVFVESLASPAWVSVWDSVRECLEGHQLAVLATVISGPNTGRKLLLFEAGDRVGDLGSEGLNAFVAAKADQGWETRTPALFAGPEAGGQPDVFLDFLAPPPRLVIIGAVHIAIPLVRIAKTLDYTTIVVDPRSAFASRARFPHVDELLVEWPSLALEKLRLDASTFVVCLSHDDKIDLPALQYALDTPAPYVGILGSRKTHAKRLSALRQARIPDEKLERIHAPIGLDLGARSPEEIALAIMAEIVASQHGASPGWKEP